MVMMGTRPVARYCETGATHRSLLNIGKRAGRHFVLGTVQGPATSSLVWGSGLDCDRERKEKDETADLPLAVNTEQ